MEENKTSRSRDIIALLLMIVPFIAAIALKVMNKPLSEGITVTGAMVYLTIPMPLQDLLITESQVNSLAVILCLVGICLFMTNGLSVVPTTKRQVIAEMLVETAQNFVNGNMGTYFAAFAPFVAAIMGLSALSSLSSLLGLYPPTSDLNIVAGWAILVFILITYYKLKGGLLNYLKGFADPIPVFAPFNVISELATPVSMAFRHYGNVLSGVVISTLISAALSGLTHMILGWLPGILGQFPFLEIGLPAVLSLYFDLFSGLLQAFIFAMLTMLYISNGFPKEAYEERMAKRQAKKAAA